VKSKKLEGIRNSEKDGPAGVKNAKFEIESDEMIPDTVFWLTRSYLISYSATMRLHLL
jgi:hypothetical protein